MSKEIDPQAIQEILARIHGYLEQGIKDVTVVKKQVDLLAQTKKG